ncbi:T9SS type A sorting domain-containing protein [candidate division KSB1 bacterium]|nr:T9SS type A sorting domain-containing protein [bacterium]NUM64769.1 T9SS type A sorting domain-containing protein [candidate division KSB1 bacterium]
MPAVLKIPAPEDFAKSHLAPQSFTNLRLTQDPAASEAPDIAVDPAGNAYVTWQDSRDGNWEVYFCLVSPQGRKLTSDVHVTNTGGASQRPKIAVDASGHAHLAWQEGNEIYYCKLNRAGEGLVAPKRVTGGNSETPDIAVEPEGTAGVTWTKQNGVAHEIGFRKISPAGAFVGNEIILDTEYIYLTREPHIDGDGKGSFYVAYKDYTGFFLDTRLIFHRIYPDNHTQCCFNVSSRASADHPRIAMVDDNRGYFFFLDRINNNWEAVHFSGAVFTEAAGNTSALDLAANDDTETQMLAVWQDDRDGAPEIYYSMVDNNTKTIPDTRISDFGANSTSPAVAILADGNGHFVWQDDRDGNREIYFASTVATAGKGLTLLSPNGGENWKTGATQSIWWTSNEVQWLDLEYSIDAGTTWLPIAQNIDAAMSTFAWEIPNAPSTNCLVRVIDAGDTNTRDVSDAAFTIAPAVTTVLVHGLSLSPTRPNWLWTMAEAIARRTGGIVYTLRDGQILEENERSVAGGGDRVVVMDWITESDFATLGFAEGAGDALAALLLKGALEGKWRLDNLHFIGHSRGTIVASECIERLDAWTSSAGKLQPNLNIDTNIHFTTLDAHPWDKLQGDHIADPLTADDYSVNHLEEPTLINDQPADAVVCWKNVSYADNYWHLGAGLNGLEQITAGRYRLDLSETSQNYHDMSHSNIHVWYHGTIDHAAEEDGTGAAINIGGTWYPNQQRTTRGYNFSKAVAGNIATIATLPHGQPGGTISHSQDRYFNQHHIFNGDFDFGSNFAIGQRMPGWHFHGGGGGGNVSDEGAEGGKDYHLVLNRGDASLKHNYFFIPHDADLIHFAYRAHKSSVNDELIVRVGDKEKPIPLGSSNDSYWWNFIDVTAMRGTIQTLEFALDAGGLGIDSEVWIDEVGFERQASLSLVVASPVDLHVYDASGRHTGPTSDSTWEEEIPQSRYLANRDSLGHKRQRIRLPQAASGFGYLVRIAAQGDTGSFDFEIRDLTNSSRSIIATFANVAVEPATVALCSLRLAQPVSATMQLLLDANGDGIFETHRSPDAYLHAFQILAHTQGNGRLVPMDSTYAELDTIFVNYNNSLGFHVVPDSGAEILDVQVDGVSLGPISEYTFANIRADHRLAAVFDNATKVQERVSLPASFALLQNYPNPFNAGTQIRYQLPQPATVSLALYNAVGQKVNMLISGERQNAGDHHLNWNGQDQHGALLPSGVYLCRLEATSATGRFAQTRKLLLLK